MHSIHNSDAQREASTELRAAVDAACAAHATLRDASIRRDHVMRALDPGALRRTDPAFRDADRAYRIALDDYNAHVDAVRKLFAASRGWTVGKHAFSLRQLLTATHSRSWYDYRGESWYPAIDHAEYYRLPTRPWRPAAILSHSYAPSAEITKFAADNGLSVEFLDMPSWYYPGGTTAVLFTAKVRP